MGQHKPSLEIGGRPTVARVIESAGRYDVMVIGRGDDVPNGIRVVPDRRPGGGPVAGLATALGELTSRPRVVLLVAGDLPFVTSEHLGRLVEGLGEAGPDRPTVAVTVATDGHVNWLCSAWRRAALERRLAQIQDPRGASMRSLAEGLNRVSVVDADACFDIDTPEDLKRARLRAAERR